MTTNEFFLQEQPVIEPEDDDYYRRAIAELDAAVDAGLMIRKRTNEGSMYRLTDAGRAAMNEAAAAAATRRADRSKGST